MEQDHWSISDNDSANSEKESQNSEGKPKLWFDLLF